ncbi:MAG: hypothetical protein WHT08_18225 [Bryobacteraceae bacterium]
MKFDERTRDRLLRAEVRALRARLRDLRKRIKAMPGSDTAYRRLVAEELRYHAALMALLRPDPGILTEPLPVLFGGDDD